MTYIMTDELARLCYDSGFKPRLKHGDNIIVVFDSILMDWYKFEEICEGEDEK